MNTELFCLTAAGALCLALPLAYMPLYHKQVGAAAVAGNREGLPEPTGAAGRGLRAHRNLIENLLPFAIAVIVARLIGVTNAITVSGALIFLGARVVHALTYFVGVTGLRSLAYVAGFVGTVMILTQLF